MATLLQIDFPSEGPFGAQMSEAYADLAASISAEPGLLWKIWTENATEGTAGGIYLFADEASARALFFDVNQPLTSITRGPLT